jgi:hypothetical protein
VLGGTEDPECRLLEAAKQAMQLSSVAADAIIKELRGVAGNGAAAGGLAWQCCPNRVPASVVWAPGQCLSCLFLQSPVRTAFWTCGSCW